MGTNIHHMTRNAEPDRFGVTSQSCAVMMMMRYGKPVPEYKESTGTLGGAVMFPEDLCYGGRFPVVVRWRDVATVVIRCMN